MCDQFMGSLRTSNFPLYVQSLEELLPSFFLLANYHYARWLSDMKELPTKVPEIAQVFALGKFTAQMTNTIFSSIALDQANDQMNKTVNGEGRMVVLTENAAVFEKWMTRWLGWWISSNKHYCRQTTVTKGIMSRQQHTRNDTRDTLAQWVKKSVVPG